ncbi:MAG: alpha/beta hydrolase [Bdellovibrionota bacterium]
MKRLVVTGLPCPPEAWESWLGQDQNKLDQRILSLFEVFENTQSSDLREISKYVESQIDAFEPDSIVCHGFGVSMTLLSLMRLHRFGRYLNPSLTLFNGALRGVSLRKANHPLRIQWIPYKRAAAEIAQHGGQVDFRLRPHMGRIRAMYRYIVMFNLVEGIASRLQLEKMVGVSSTPALKMPIQLIVSPDDPYIPYDAIQQLRMDFRIKTYHEVPYGHFPYSISPDKVLPILEKFERQHAASKIESPSLNSAVRSSEQLM